MTESEYLGFCEDLRAVLGIDVQCCPSCHDDADEGFTQLGEYGEPDGPGYVVACCSWYAVLGGRTIPWHLLRRRKESNRSSPC